MNRIFDAFSRIYRDVTSFPVTETVENLSFD